MWFNPTAIVMLLKSNRAWFSLWAIVAAFGVYFCTYAFRKPFTAGLYEDHTVFGMNYKIVLILTQVVGYMSSKFIGVHVIAALKPSKRIQLILLLIGVSQVGLVLFAVLPKQLAWAAMFLNGLPLGMVWGVVFSFLEGRKVTEMLALGLSANMILTSGVLKTIYFFIHQVTGLSEFAMPAVLGFLFLIPLLGFVWMLSVLPPPTAEDKQLRSKRIPMQKRHKRVAMGRYGFGIVLIIGIYALLTTMRDFRDNFAVEIWQEIDPQQDFTIFAKMEAYITVFVLLGVGLLAVIKDNLKAYGLICGTFLAAFACVGIATKAYTNHGIMAHSWMLLLGVGLFFPYILIQIAYFERIIALFKIKGNVGYFVYLCDSVGYLGSVGILFYKEFVGGELTYSAILVAFATLTAILGGIFTLLQLVFFTWKYIQAKLIFTAKLHYKNN